MLCGCVRVLSGAAGLGHGDLAWVTGCPERWGGGGRQWEAGSLPCGDCEMFQKMLSAESGVLCVLGDNRVREGVRVTLQPGSPVRAGQDSGHGGWW